MGVRGSGVRGRGSGVGEYESRAPSPSVIPPLRIVERGTGGEDHRRNAPVGNRSGLSSRAGCFSSRRGSCLKRRSKDRPMSFLVQWIPALAVGFILLIAALVLEALIRAERRRHVPPRAGPGPPNPSPPPPV